MPMAFGRASREWSDPYVRPTYSMRFCFLNDQG